MAETRQGAIVPVSEAPNPTPDHSERATAILAWVLEHQIIVRRIDIGVGATYRACRKLKGGRLHHLGKECWTQMDAIISAFLEANQ